MDLKAIESGLQQLITRTQHERTRPIASHLQDDGILAGLNQDIALTDSMSAGWWQKAGAVLRDPRYSDVGRQGEMKKIAARAVDEAKPLKTRMDTLLEAMTHARGLFDFRKPEKSSDPHLSYWRAREIRDRDGLSSRPQRERDVAFLKAAEAANLEVMRALTVDVPGGPLVSDEALQRGTEIYGRKVAPEAVELLEKLEVRRDRLQGLMDHVAKALLTMGAGPDEIRTLLGVKMEEDGRAA